MLGPDLTGATDEERKGGDMVKTGNAGKSSQNLTKVELLRDAESEVGFGDSMCVRR